MIEQWMLNWIDQQVMNKIYKWIMNWINEYKVFHPIKPVKE